MIKTQFCFHHTPPASPLPRRHGRPPSPPRPRARRPDGRPVARRRGPGRAPPDAGGGAGLLCAVAVLRPGLQQRAAAGAGTGAGQPEVCVRVCVGERGRKGRRGGDGWHDDSTPPPQSFPFSQPHARRPRVRARPRAGAVPVRHPAPAARRPRRPPHPPGAVLCAGGVGLSGAPAGGGAGVAAGEKEGAGERERGGQGQGQGPSQGPRGQERRRDCGRTWSYLLLRRSFCICCSTSSVRSAASRRCVSSASVRSRHTQSLESLPPEKNTWKDG